MTAYSETFGYPSSGRFYFKMGLYRDQTAETMKIYIDEYKKKELPEPSLGKSKDLKSLSSDN